MTWRTWNRLRRQRTDRGVDGLLTSNSSGYHRDDTFRSVRLTFLLQTRGDRDSCMGNFCFSNLRASLSDLRTSEVVSRSILCLSRCAFRMGQFSLRTSRSSGRLCESTSTGNYNHSTGTDFCTIRRGECSCFSVGAACWDCNGG